MLVRQGIKLARLGMMPVVLAVVVPERLPIARAALHFCQRRT
jgi:hypothetical protein